MKSTVTCPRHFFKWVIDRPVPYRHAGPSRRLKQSLALDIYMADLPGQLPEATDGHSLGIPGAAIRVLTTPGCETSKRIH